MLCSPLGKAPHADCAQLYLCAQIHLPALQPPTTAGCWAAPQSQAAAAACGCPRRYSTTPSCMATGYCSAAATGMAPSAATQARGGRGLAIRLLCVQACRQRGAALLVLSSPAPPPPSPSRNPPTPAPAVDDGRPLQSLCYHRDVVSCLAASSDGRAVASGSRDTTVMLWDVNLGYGKGESRNMPDTTVMLQDVNLGPPLCCAGPHSPSCPCVQRPRAGVRTTATTTPRCRWCRDHATCCTDTKTRWVCGSGGKGLSVRGWGVGVNGRCGCGWVGGWISEGGGVGARAQCMQMRAGTASGHALCRNTHARLRPLASLHAAHASPAVHAA